MCEKIVTNEEGEIIMPFWKGFLYPLRKIAQSGSKFFILTGGFSFVCALLSSALGRSFLCGVGIDLPGIYCSSSLLSVFLSAFIFIACSGCYISSWYNISENNQNVKVHFGVKELKIASCVLGYCLCWIVLSGLAYVLTARIPVPDWKVELAFFCGISLIMMFVLYVLLNAVVVVRFLQAKKEWYLRKVFVVVWDNLYKPFAWFFIYVLFFSLFLRDCLVFFVRYEHFPVWLNAFCGDFAFYFLLYWGIAVFISVLVYQAKYIYADED